MGPVISARDVNHHYGSGALRRQILFNVSAEILPGEIVIITGPSGSGKTTLLTLAGALRSVEEGSLRVLDHELHCASKEDLVLVQEVIDDFETWAVCRCPEYETYVRIAPMEGGLLIDLADKTRHVCRIEGDIFRLEKSNGVKFIRPLGLASLPFPAGGMGGLDLKPYLNLDKRYELLFYAWLTGCLRPSGPYPVLVLSGVQGSGKSTLTKIVRALVDPSTVALTDIPDSERNLAIAAANTHMLAFDNVSKITNAMSDALCRTATGGAYRRRKLYTSDDETLLRFCKPQIINGIENLVLRPDLLDRSILIHMQKIEPGTRQTERELWQAFTKNYPEILGAFYMVAGAALSSVKDIRLENPPRMADFAAWGCAIERLLGYSDGQFLEDYAANRKDADALAIEASPVADLIRRYLLQSNNFHGTAKKLLEELNHFRSDGEGKHPDWPKAPSQLSALLARIEPVLETEGITVERSRNGNNKIIKLTMKEN